MEFVEFQKIARLSRDCVVTEKIDGTNAQVFIAPLDELTHAGLTALVTTEVDRELVGMMVGSRSRYLTLTEDNFGFAKWAWSHALELFTLGPGRHFGEWWGSGIQRGYGLPQGEKRFSLFNVARWHEHGREMFISHPADPRQPQKLSDECPACCHVVPVLYRGSFDSMMGHVDDILSHLVEDGSVASCGFDKPEGIVIFHTAGGYLFKKTIEKDDEPKRQAR